MILSIIVYIGLICNGQENTMQYQLTWIKLCCVEMLSSRLWIDALRIAPKVVNVKMGKQIIMQQAAMLNIATFDIIIFLDIISHSTRKVSIKYDIEHCCLLHYYLFPHIKREYHWQTKHKDKISIDIIEQYTQSKSWQTK
jgi:hypothetical protein